MFYLLFLLIGNTYYPPINTVVIPGGMTIPPAAVKSLIRAAGMPPMSTVADPFKITSAPQLSVIRAAGNPPINTLLAPGGIIGTGAPEVAGLIIMSLTLAAGGISYFLKIKLITYNDNIAISTN
jgi:hypothetical protein